MSIEMELSMKLNSRQTPHDECMRCHAPISQRSYQPPLCKKCIQELGKNTEVNDYAN